MFFRLECTHIHSSKLLGSTCLLARRCLPSRCELLLHKITFLSEMQLIRILFLTLEYTHFCLPSFVLSFKAQLRSHLLHETFWESITSTQLDRLHLCFRALLGFVFPLRAYTRLNYMPLLLACEHHQDALYLLHLFCQHLTIQIILSFKWGQGDSTLSFSQQKEITPLALSQLHLPRINPGNQESQKEKATIQKSLRPSLAIHSMTKCTDPGLQTVRRNWLGIPALCHPNYVNLGKSLNLSLPPFSHMWKSQTVFMRNKQASI